MIFLQEPKDKIWDGKAWDRNPGYEDTIYIHSQQLSHKDMGNAQDSIMCTFTHFLTNTGFSLGPVSSSESEYSSYSED